MTQDSVVPPAPEFARPTPLARVRAGARFVVEARPEECRALGARMGIEAVHSLTCRFDLRRAVGDTVEASGLLQARVRQACVVSLEAFDADVTEDFTLRFVPEGRQSDDLDLDAEDEVTYAGATIDLGEAAAEQLALALDPFPRKPGAEMLASAAAEDPAPFSALAKLRSPH